MNFVEMDKTELPLHLQQTFLETSFRNWKGDTEQTDDICIMGIKI